MAGGEMPWQGHSAPDIVVTAMGVLVVLLVGCSGVASASPPPDVRPLLASGTRTYFAGEAESVEVPSPAGSSWVALDPWVRIVEVPGKELVRIENIGRSPTTLLRTRGPLTESIVVHPLERKKAAPRAATRRPPVLVGYRGRLQARKGPNSFSQSHVLSYQHTERDRTWSLSAGVAQTPVAFGAVRVKASYRTPKWTVQAGEVTVMDWNTPGVGGALSWRPTPDTTVRMFGAAIAPKPQFLWRLSDNRLLGGAGIQQRLGRGTVWGSVGGIGEGLGSEGRPWLGLGTRWVTRRIFGMVTGLHHLDAGQVRASVNAGLWPGARLGLSGLGYQEGFQRARAGASAHGVASLTGRARQRVDRLEILATATHARALTDPLRTTDLWSGMARWKEKRWSLRAQHTGRRSLPSGLGWSSWEARVDTGGRTGVQTQHRQVFRGTPSKPQNIQGFHGIWRQRQAGLSWRFSHSWNIDPERTRVTQRVQAVGAWNDSWRRLQLSVAAAIRDGELLPSASARIQQRLAKLGTGAIAGQVSPQTWQVAFTLSLGIPLKRSPFGGQIEGRLFEDLDADGVFDDGEPMISDVGVEVDGRAYPVDSDGSFRVRGLNPGDHDLELETGDWLQVAGEDTITVQSAQKTTLWVPLVTNRQRVVRVLEDRDHDGLLSEPDRAMNAGDVELLLDGAVLSREQLFQGEAHFRGVPDGEVRVRLAMESLPTGTLPVGPPVRPLTDEPLVFLVRRSRSLSGQVTMDSNGDGERGRGDQPARGVEVSLSNGASTTTDGQGRFRFTGLSAMAVDVTVGSQTEQVEFEHKSEVKGLRFLVPKP